MSHNRLVVSSAIIALAILISFVLSVPHTRDVAQKLPSTVEATSIPVITLRDSFKKGVHTITGSLETPNACTVVNASATLAGNASSTESIIVAISVRSDSGVCLQLRFLLWQNT